MFLKFGDIITMFVFVTQAMVAILLLISGDVELNPGPQEKGFTNVDKRVLSENDHREVLRESVKIKAKCFQLGRELGLPAAELDAIRTDCPQDIDQAFDRILLGWLRQKYNTDKYGLPTWRRLVEAIDDSAGGDNHALAMKIAASHSTIVPNIIAKLKPSHNSLIEGMTNFTLTCHVSGADQLRSPDIEFKFTWRKDNSELSPELVSGIQSHSNQAKVQLSPLQISHIGLYTCMITVTSTSDTEIITIINSDHYDLKIQRIAIYLKPSMDFIPVFHQNDFSLECVTVGIEQNVEISYTWMKDGNPVLSRLVKDESTMDMKVLFFSPLGKIHQGKYTCRARIPASHVPDLESSDGFIILTSEPYDVTIESITSKIMDSMGSGGEIFAGEKYFSLTCKVFGVEGLVFPDCKYLWKKWNLEKGNYDIIKEATTHVRTLSLSPLKLSHAGQYVCDCSISSFSLSKEIYQTTELHSVRINIPVPVSLKITCNIGDMLQGYPLQCVMTLKPEMDAPIIINTEWVGPTSSVQNVVKYCSNTTVTVSVVAPFTDVQPGQSYTCVASITSTSQNLIGSKQVEAKFEANFKTSLVQLWNETLIMHYRRQIDKRAWPPVKATNFINLALIKDQTSWRETIQESLDEIVGEKVCLSYETMFNNVSDYGDNVHFILLQGKPGSGKTTLVNKLSMDWAKQEMLKNKLLFLVHLRELNAYSDHNLAAIVKQACPALDDHNPEQLVSLISEVNGRDVVFAFDGFDEYSMRDNDIVIELMKGNRLPGAWVIVTSRPAACTEYRQMCEMQIEVLGFVKENISLYIKCYYSDNKKKADLLMDHLESHPNLMNICYLPLHCAMLVFLNEEYTVLPETETEFYKHFTLSTLLRSVRKRHGTIPRLTSYNDLEKDDKILFDNVCKLAFEATLTKKQVFKRTDLEHLTINLGYSGNDEDSLGLVVSDRYFIRYGLDETYTFLHLTFQEYLGAVHLAGLSKSEQISIIKCHREKRHLYVMWRFLCGVMDFTDPHTMKVFKNLMTTNPKAMFQIKCAYESQSAKPCDHVITSSLCGKIDFNKNMSPADFAAILYVISHANYHKTYHFIFETSCNLTKERAQILLHLVAKNNFTAKFQNGGGSRYLMEAVKCEGKPLPGLLELELRFCKLDLGGVKALADCLHYCNNLHSLNLYGASIGPDGIKALCRSLVLCHNLKNFNCGNNHIHDDGCSFLDSLKDCNHLQTLNLCWNSLSDDCLPYLIEMINTHKCLKELRLGGNRFTDNGLSSLKKTIKQRKKAKGFSKLEITEDEGETSLPVFES